MPFSFSAPGDKVVLPVKKKVLDDDEAEEVTTVEGAKVKVTRRYDLIIVPEGGDADTKKETNSRKRKSPKPQKDPVSTKKSKTVNSSGKNKKSKKKQIK